MTEQVKAGAGYEIRHLAKQILEATAKAAEKGQGVRVQNMPGESGVYRQSAARYLRQMGVPLYAQQAADQSIWFLLLDEDEMLMAEWKRRIVYNAYAETCRAHMALSYYKDKTPVRALGTAAVAFGGLLNYDLERVVRDVAPASRPQWVSETLSGIIVVE